MENTLNNFGGHWTEKKIEIFGKYLKAYLTIMNKQSFKLIYFDGFAGCGTIKSKTSNTLIESVAIQVLSLDHQKKFDMYYLVDTDQKKIDQLSALIDEKFPNRLFKDIFPAKADCNEKVLALTNYLKEPTSNPRSKNHRVLAFIDPFGMSINWKTLEACKGLGIDMWILVPTGIGVTRMLANDGNISDEWLLKLERFLGLKREEIKQTFYHTRTSSTLFGEETYIQKTENIVNKIAHLYQDRLKNIWVHASKPFAMKNSNGSILYHFILATNNVSGLGIADSIIGK